MLAGIRPGPTVESLRLAAPDAAGALASFSESCPRLLRRSDYGIAVGNPADFVLWNARSRTEAVATVAQPLFGYKRGRRIFTRELPELHRP